ncbi:MAG: hypothetical protein EZS28_032011, partial [Streblomastix strix]
MDKPVERNQPDGVEDYIQLGGALDLEFSIGDYSKLNLHQKIDLAYKRMVDVGLDLFPLPPPSTSPDIPDIRVFPKSKSLAQKLIVWRKHQK